MTQAPGQGHLPKETHHDDQPNPWGKIKIVAAALAVVLLLAAVSWGLLKSGSSGSAAGDAPETMEFGVVTDTNATRLAGVVVTNPDGSTITSDSDGRFPVKDEGVYAARLPGYLARAAAGTPAFPPHIQLSPEAGAISLRFGGDTMFGRRFYEPGDNRPPYLKPGATVDDHARLLSAMAPLLNDSDVTVVNLETPLVREPYFPEDQRPPTFHPTKDIAFGSALESAQALRRSGVDLVTVGNNHLADAFGPGVQSTLAALDEAGVAHTGGGSNVEEAWKPAFVTIRGKTVAFISCTTVAGKPGEIPYVAGPDRPGAAECQTKRLQEAVKAALTTANDAVVMIHGDVEYQREQAPIIRALSSKAQEAGARVVVNGHPHVVGGLVANPNGIVAESMGNLLFDQKIWQTLLSYVLRVELPAEGPVTATTDAIALQDFIPRPAVGPMADSSARIAAGTVLGEAQLSTAGASASTVPPTTPDVIRENPQAGIHRLAPGWWASNGDNGVKVGQDLLWGTGMFEDPQKDNIALPSGLWELGQWAKTSASGACDSRLGVQMLRSPVSLEDVFVSTAHRQQVAPGQSLTLLAEIRGASPGASLELSWYAANEGPSIGGNRVTIPQSPADAPCETIRIDATVPDGVIAAQPFFRLAPPGSTTLSSSLYVDNVRLIQWATPGTYGRLYDTVEASPGSSAEFTRDPAAGSDAPGPLLAEPTTQSPLP